MPNHTATILPWLALHGEYGFRFEGIVWSEGVNEDMGKTVTTVIATLT